MEPVSQNSLDAVAIFSIGDLNACFDIKALQDWA